MASVPSAAAVHLCHENVLNAVVKKESWFADLHSLDILQLSEVVYNQQHRWLADVRVLVGLLDAARQLELQIRKQRSCCWELENSNLRYTYVSHLIRYRTM